MILLRKEKADMRDYLHTLPHGTRYVLKSGYTNLLQSLIHRLLANKTFYFKNIMKLFYHHSKKKGPPYLTGGAVV